MNANIVIPGLTAVVSAAMALAVADQWLSRHRRYQAVWAIGMAMFAIAAATEAIGEAFGWNAILYKTWYLTGAIWVAGWLGLGTVFLLSKTRFGFTFAVLLFLSGLFTLLTQVKQQYAGADPWQWVYFVAAIAFAVAIGWETYFGSERWATIAAIAVVGATLLSAAMTALATLPAPGYALDPRSGIPVGDLLPGYVRLLTPFLNISGGLALVLGAVYSAYIFMPKRRVLAYSLREEGMSGDEFWFNLAIAPFAIAVNLVASLPGAIRALFAGRLHSRVPATILIAIGGFIPSVGTGLERFGPTSPFYITQLLGAVFLLAGFLASIEVFGEFRIPFTRVHARPRVERADAARGTGAADATERRATT